MDKGISATIQAYFAEVSDPRVERTKLHLMRWVSESYCSDNCGAGDRLRLDSQGQSRVSL